MAQISQFIAFFFSSVTCCITYDNSFTFLILPYICCFSSIDRCFVLPVLFFLATYSFASLIFHQVYPGSPHSVLLFLPHQKSGTTVSSPVLQTDSPFLWFCTLPSETALTTHRGQREKCFFCVWLTFNPSSVFVAHGLTAPHSK